MVINKQLSFRTGTMNDLDELQELGIVSYSQFQNALTADNWSIFDNNLHNKQKFIDLLKIAKCFVSVDDEKIVGVAYIVPSGNPTEIFQADWSYIRMVAVNPAYRGQGISKTLATMCIDYAKHNKEK